MSLGLKFIVEIKGFKPALFSLALSLLCTFFASFLLMRDAQHQALGEFQNSCDEIVVKINDRIAGFEMALRGAAGILNASESVSRKQWHTYIHSLDANKTIPGVTGIGFNPIILPKQLASHTALMHQEGFPDYSVRPIGQRSMYAPIMYIEPFEGKNLRALGFDVYSEPIRREAMERARDSGEAALTGKLQLIQEDGKDPQNGVIMFLPIYRKNVPLSTVLGRQVAIIGWVSGPYRIGDLMTGIMSEATLAASVRGINLRIYDGLKTSQATQLFESTPNRLPSRSSILHVQREIHFDAGSNWLLDFDGSATAHIVYTKAWIMLISGITISILIFWLILTISRTKIRATQIARQLTTEIGALNSRLSIALQAGSVGIWDWDIINNSLVWDEQMYRLYGIPKDKFSGAYEAWQSGLHPDDKLSSDQEIQKALRNEGEFNTEFRVVFPNGDIRYLRALAAVQRDADGEPIGMIGTNWDITEQKIAEKKAVEYAFTDPLTSLPNRRLFSDRLERALNLSKRSKQHCALLAIDIDNFKTINDLHGHDIGDLVLKASAKCFLKAVRVEDTIARMGGDEFMILLEGLGEDAFEANSSAQLVAENILGSFNALTEFPSVVSRGSLSIGVTSFKGGLQITADELMKQSDMALYQAKQAGRNRMKFYDTDMQNLLNARVVLEETLRQAIENEWFVLFYQPQVDINRQITCAEVLLRINHPERGLVSPAEFIPLAESTGLILPIGWWVLNTVCEQLSLWALRKDMANLTLSVNISLKQFMEVNFVSKLVEITDRFGVNPRMLTLELTESIFMSDQNDVMLKTSSLKALGFSFSLDDFGTGYSSLAYLNTLDFNELKIDKAFIEKIPESKIGCNIVKTIILMGETLDVKIVAEGVETAEQFEYLKTIGCHYFQGYLFFHPITLAEFITTIEH